VRSRFAKTFVQDFCLSQKSKTVELILTTHIVFDMLSSFFPILKLDILLSCDSCRFCCDVGDAYGTQINDGVEYYQVNDVQIKMVSKFVSRVS